MRRLPVFVACFTLLIVAGVAIAQSGEDQKNQKIDEAIATLEEAKAIPADVVTVTETITATVTQTVTASPTTPPPTTPPPPACTGVQVAAGANLGTVFAAEPAGTTFCLAAGTYTVGTTNPVLEDGDVVMGAGRDTTFIVPADFDADLFTVSSGAAITVQAVDIDGPEVESISTTCAPQCGRVFSSYAGGITLRDMNCHDAGTACIGGGGQATSLTVLDNVACDHNGYHPDTLLPDFRSAACVKLNNGSLTATGSTFTDNAWVALWCDFCDNTDFLVEGNTFTHNGRGGVSWEVSGHFVAGDNAIIRNNVFHDNGWNEAVPHGAGHSAIRCDDCSHLLVELNTFGGNLASDQGGDGFKAIKLLDGSRVSGPLVDVVIQNNTLNGDRIDTCTLTGVTCSGNS